MDWGASTAKGEEESLHWWLPLIIYASGALCKHQVSFYILSTASMSYFKYNDVVYLLRLLRYLRLELEVISLVFVSVDTS